MTVWSSERFRACIGTPAVRTVGVAFDALPSWRAVWQRSGAFEAATLLPLLAVVLGAWAFLYLGGEVREGDTRSFDVWAVRSLRQPGDLAPPIGPVWLPEVARDLTALGSASLLTIFSAVVVGFLCLRRQFRAAGFLAASLAGGVALSAGFKAFYARPRPMVVPHLTTFDSASFPSGHSLLSSVAYLTIGVVLARLARGRDAKLYFLGVGAALAFLVGLSRIYLGVHYPTDVLAGWVLGVSWAILCSLVARRLQQRAAVAQPTDEPAGPLHS